MSKILIIEDQPQMRRNLAFILEMEKFEVVVAENGRQGIELARQKQPDLVICDVMMPEQDGYAVLQTLRAEKTTANVPFIFLTSLRGGIAFGAPFPELNITDRASDALQLRLPGFLPPSALTASQWEAKLRNMTPQAVVDEYVTQTPMGRLEEPEDVAKSVLFLASDLAGFITGESLNVTGGVRMD